MRADALSGQLDSMILATVAEDPAHGYAILGRLRERSYGAFERAVSLPPAANPEKIDAKFKNGILTITVAKDGQEKLNVRKIRIGHES